MSGAINSVLLKKIAATMQENDGVKIALDLSEATGITAIKDYFAGLENLYSVNLGNTVTTIGENAFKGCTALVSVKIPDSVTTIESAAFADCEALKNLAIPDSVTTFVCNLDGVNLENLYIGSGVENLGECKTSSVKNLYIDSNFTSFKGAVNVVIGDNVTEIAEKAFYEQSSLTTVKIGKKVSSIGEKAFFGCIKIKTVELYPNIETFGAYSFRYEGFSSYEKEQLPENRTVYFNGTKDEFTTCLIKWQDFVPVSNCTNAMWRDSKIYADLYVDGEPLTELVIAALGNVESYASYASMPKLSLKNCATLESVVYSGYRFGNFEGCKNLKKVVFYGAEILDGAFKDTSVEEFTYINRYTTISSYYSSDYLEDLQNFASKYEYNGRIQDNLIHRWIFSDLKAAYFPTGDEWYMGDKMSFYYKGVDYASGSINVGPFTFSSDGKANVTLMNSLPANYISMQYRKPIR
ncbi:MAG: leucine-rich repeat domain-containing protein [Spirochaetaceae bacterium]|nr:leucine-rich repeat domain-containing protein [Spirochaetaceae bacterium]